ncbi:MAG: endo-1,3-alpha-glucanase family glycosylhydrolase [Xanthobacteraceae bacterium]|nr:endo-1,3-alpha-glucanase family glycosylhydrolase [Xanthobacteraceae bacterium]
MKISLQRIATLVGAAISLAIAVPAAAQVATTLDPSILPFNQPSRTVLAASPRKVFAHWHEFPFRYYGDPSATDGYAVSLNPAGFSDQFFGAGNWMRNRPIPLAEAVQVDTDADAQKDLALDVALAANIGIDAFLLNCWYGPEDFRWQAQMVGMFNAADAYSSRNVAGFSVVPNIDASLMAARLQANPNDPVAVPETVADNLATLKSHRSFMRMGTKYMVGAFAVEYLPVSWYQRFLSRLKIAHGMDVYFSGVFVDPTKRPAYASLLQLYSRWTIDPYTQITSEASDKAWASSRGIAFMSDVAQSYDRPLNLITSETGGFQTEIETWTRAINDGAQAVQIITWNDHSEGTNLRPNTSSQYAFYDIAAYYISWYKTGVKPTITRDVLYYSHRMEPTTAPHDATKQAGAYVSKNGVPFENNVYLVGFLTQPGSLEIRSGGTLHQQAVGAGVQSMSAPLAVNDRPQFSLVRGGLTKVSVVSAFGTRSKSLWQDLLYRAGGSTRSTVASVQNNLPEDRWTH